MMASFFQVDSHLAFSILFPLDNLLVKPPVKKLSSLKMETYLYTHPQDIQDWLSLQVE